MRKPHTAPTLRQLAIGDLTEDQRRWIEATKADRARWTWKELGALGLAAGLAIGAIALCIFVLSLVAGCAVSDAVYVDRRFTPDEQVEIQKAADYWCDATGGAACVDLVFGARVGRLSTTATDGRRVLVRATEAEAMRAPSPLLRKGDNGVRWLNYDELGVRAEEVIVVVPSRIEPGFFRTVVAHELGHHFDLNHVAAAGALMFTKGDTPEGRAHVDAECLTAADAAELCNSHDCGRPRVCAP